MSLLTIVTVVKDDAVGLLETLVSLRGQSSLNFSLIVLDGSTDRNEAPEIIGQFHELPVDYHWAEPRGVYSAMNQALTFVRSPYVYFLNAGDSLADAEVVSRLNLQLQAHNPVWAFGHVHFFSEAGDPLPEPAWSYEVEFDHLFARGVFPAHQGVIVRTDALREQGGFDTGYRVAADYASILKCARISVPLALGFPLARFRQGGLSTHEWRLSLREFHRARISVFAPTGWPAVRERIDTARLYTKTYAYRALQGIERSLSRQTRSAPRDSIRP